MLVQSPKDNINHLNVIMIHTQRLGFSGCYFLLFLCCFFSSCDRPSSSAYSFTELELPTNTALYSDFSTYCALTRQSGNHELNAVLCAFIGDYSRVLHHASMNADARVTEDNLINISGDLPNIDLIDSVINDPTVDENQKILARQFKSLMQGEKTVEDYLKGASLSNATEHISKESRRYHFTLINEAHYCSQHRCFTTGLLKPLWQQGYRYLALETANVGDSVLMERGYPTTSTGYYTKDSNFGNMIREALDLGYTIIPYETEVNNVGTLRDLDQAKNIIKRTWEKDKEGKVLVHAGYSHINEIGGDSYKPLGYHLKTLLNTDIYTVDQVNMTWLDYDKLHPFYKYLQEHHGIDEPIMPIDSSHRPIVEPLLDGSVDAQVYHPQPTFDRQRPTWLLENRKVIKLPSKIMKLKGHWIRVFPYGESESAIPVDQFVIEKGSVIAVDSEGKYLIHIIGCDGSLKHVYELTV